MAENKAGTPIGSLGEFGLIKRLSKNFITRQTAHTKLGIGDDGAILSYKDEAIVVSTDLLMEGIHFDLIYTPLKHLGYKAVVVNLSDIYAMNAFPKQITFSMALSKKFSVEAVDALYEGVEQACRFYGVDLIGGDTTSSMTGMCLSVTAIGGNQEEKLVKRSTAQVGDVLCVTGNLGAAYLGLQVLEREKTVFLESPGSSPQLDDYSYLVERQLKPEARKDLIELMDKHDVIPSAMIDISDGLSSDLLHICYESSVGAEIYEENLPVHEQAKRVGVQEFKISPTTCALSGGEDYELLFTIKREALQKLDGLIEIKVIGKIVDKEKGVHLFSPKGEKHPITAQGWNHLT